MMFHKKYKFKKKEIHYNLLMILKNVIDLTKKGFN